MSIFRVNFGHAHCFPSTDSILHNSRHPVEWNFKHAAIISCILPAFRHGWLALDSAHVLDQIES